jgi:hypothetical protein
VLLAGPLTEKKVLPVPPFATGNVPVTPVDRGMFVTVLLAPLIVLLVSVSVPDSVAATGALSAASLALDIANSSTDPRHHQIT